MASDSKSKKKKGEEKSSKSKSKGKEDKDNSRSRSKSPSKIQKSKPADKKAAKSKKDDRSDASSVIPTAPPAADCVHHKNPFIYYCETCEELICNQCTVYGPHNNHLHRILKITDAYRSRVFFLSEAIRTNLVDKRDRIIAQLHRLEYRSEEIRFVKNIISRDIRSEYAGVLERLKSVEGIKLANLSHEVSLVQRELDTINDLGNNFFELTSMDGELSEQERKICKFLMKSKKMYEAIEYLREKPERPLPDIKVHELPREIQENKCNIQKALAAKQINDFKNEVIYNLTNDLKEQEAKIKQSIEAKANETITELSSKVEALNSRLNEFKLICHYCGVRMSHEIVNEHCEANIHKGQHSLESHSTIKTPPQSYDGNGRHFFSKKIAQP